MNLQGQMNRRTTDSADQAIAATPANPRAPEAIRFGFLVWDVSRLWRVVLDRVLKPLGVTRSQYSVIAVLSRRDGMTQTALAADLELSKVAVGGLVERMEAVGLVERRADQSDARVRRVYLTRKGTQIIRKIRDLADPVEAEMLASLSDAQLSSAIATLDTVKDVLLELGGAGVDDIDPPRSQRERLNPASDRTATAD